MALNDINQESGSSLAAANGLNTSVYPTGIGNEAEALSLLDSATIPAFSFYADGDYMDFEYHGVLAGDAATQAIVAIHDVILFDSGVVDPGTDEAFKIVGRLTKASSAGNAYLISNVVFSTSTLYSVQGTSATFAYFNEPSALQLTAIATLANDVLLYAGHRQFYLNR